MNLKRWIPRKTKTPAGGISFRHSTKDMCCTMYRDYIKFFYCRRKDIGSTATEMIPALYSKAKVLEIPIGVYRSVLNQITP